MRIAIKVMRPFHRFFVIAISIGIVATGLTVPQSARADQWMPPQIEVYLSPDEATRLTVVPRGIASPLAYFRDKVDGREKAGQRKGGNDQPRAQLERRDEAGVWKVVWVRPLVNDVSPVSAIVENSGSHFVTFDNWHSAGFGSDVIVIYDQDGKLIRSLGLSDILPDEYIKALPRSVSSIWWSGDHKIVGNDLIVSVVVPSEDGPGSERTYVELDVDLKSGDPVNPSGASWDEALASARRKNIKTAEWEAKRHKEMMVPLVAPTSGMMRDWESYLDEAFYRIAKDWSQVSPLAYALPASRDSVEYKEALKRIRGILNEHGSSDYALLFGSPESANFTAVLEAEAKKVGRGKLKATQVYVAIGVEFWPRLQAAFASSGAKLIRIDPAVAIPQNPERL